MKFFTSVLFACFAFCAAAQNPATLNELGHWDDDSLPLASPGGLNLQYSGVWGLAVNGHEFAVVGGAAHVLFFDVTNPGAPVLVGKFSGAQNTIWREFKSYKNRVYAVSDGTTEGLMIFDLTNAPDTIVRTYWSSEFFEKSHTITLDTLSGHIYLNGSNVAGNGLLVLDVSVNPDQPTFRGAFTLPGGYIHDSYVRGDTVYASSGYSGYYIYDFKISPATPTVLASVSTGGYNHNSWLTNDGHYAYYAEEIPKGQPIRVVDLQNLAQNEIEVVNSFLHPMLNDPAGPLAIPHNVYVRDGFLFDSQYEDGLLVYDIQSDPVHPSLFAWYDTHPENTIYNGYYGCWGNYPWLPSGNIIATDMQNGLFMLQNPLSVRTETVEKSPSLRVFPNPASDFLLLQTDFPGDWQFSVLDLNGKLMQRGRVSGKTLHEIPVSDFPAGVYFLSVQSENGLFLTRKWVKI